MSRRAWPQRGGWLGACAGALGASLTLSGCPLSDDYYVDRDEGPATSSSGGSTGATTDSIDSGGSTSLGGATGSGGNAGGNGGSGGTSNSGGTGGTGASGGAGGSGGSAVEQCTRCSGSDCDEDECEDGWAVMAAPPTGFQAREKAAYAATDLRLFVWGGLNADGDELNTGALYDPEDDSWEEIQTDSNTPSPRHSASAVWNGREMIVWGGISGSTTLDDGGIYDLTTGEWSSMTNGPTARAGAVAAWIGSSDRAAFWGGQTETGNLLEGIDFYDPGDDDWQSGGVEQDPGKRRYAAWAEGTLTFWVFGGLRDGSQLSGDGSYYSMSNDQWVNVGGFSGSERWGAFGRLVDLDFFIWGGRDSAGPMASGARYPLGGSQSATWSTFTSDDEDEPSARYAAFLESGWAFTTGSDMFVLAGLDEDDNYLRDGGVYDTAEDRWESIPNWPSNADHAFGAVVLIPNSELIVWGGRNGSSLTSEGHRYLHP